MIARKVMQEDLYKALEVANQKYDGNIKFRRLDKEGSGFRFTLTVNTSKGLGTRLATSPLMSERSNGFISPMKRRKIAAACWHVHGDFFDALFSVNPQATVRSRNNLITSNDGNWQDFNLGSQMFPVYASEACVCN